MSAFVSGEFKLPALGQSTEYGLIILPDPLIKIHMAPSLFGETQKCSSLCKYTHIYLYVCSCEYKYELFILATPLYYLIVYSGFLFNLFSSG